MAGIRMHISMGRELEAHMRKVNARARDLEPALRSIGEYGLQRTEQHFAEEKDPEGRPWQPLKVRTLYSSHRGRKYTKKGKLTKRFSTYVQRRKILTDSHNLRNRIVYKVGRGWVAIGTNVIYARAHQEGAEFSIRSTRAHIRIPARPFLGFNVEDERHAMNIVTDHLTEVK